MEGFEPEEGQGPTYVSPESFSCLVDRGLRGPGPGRGVAVPPGSPHYPRSHVEKVDCQPAGLGSRGCGYTRAWPGGLLLLSLVLAFPGAAPWPRGQCVCLTPTPALASASGRGSQETRGQLCSRQFSPLISSLNCLLGGRGLCIPTPTAARNPAQSFPCCAGRLGLEPSWEAVGWPMSLVGPVSPVAP